MERWKINLYTVWFSQVFSIMSFSFGMPFLPFYIQELGVTTPDSVKLYSGILNAAPAVTMAIMSPIWGIVSDKFGRKLMLMRAMFFAAFIIGSMGLVSSINQLLFLRLLQGIFTGTITAAAVLVAANTPKNKLSFALGFLSSSTFIGQSIGPVIGGFVAEFAGYRISFIIGGILMFLDFLLVLFVVKENKAPIEKVEKKEKTDTSLISVFTMTIVFMLLLLLFIRIGRTIFNPYLPIYVQETRGTTEGIASVTGMINGVIGFMTALAGLTLSRLGDKYNKMKLLAAYLTLGIIFSIPLTMIHNLWLFTAALGILFFITGGIEPLIMSVTTEHTATERRGILFGVQGTVGSIGFALAPLLGGMVAIKYSTKAVLLFIPIFLLLGAMVTSIILFQKRKAQK